MQNLETLYQARRIAQELLARAKENESQLTAKLQIIAREVSAEIVGLENKFKSEKSLTRKLLYKSYGDLQKLLKKTRTINDVLRYTFVLPIGTYAENIRQTIKRLRDLGYRVPEDKIWNAWQNIGSAKDRGYRGINITVISSQNQKFELQFHTEESFNLKEETHFLYEELRAGKISSTGEKDLIDTLKTAAESIEKPNGV